MGRPRKIENLYKSRVDNRQFTEGQKSKGILDDFAVRKVINASVISAGKLYGDGSNLSGAGVKDHSALTNLNWAAAGHTIDTNIDMNGNHVESSGAIKLLPDGKTTCFQVQFTGGGSLLTISSTTGNIYVADSLLPFSTASNYDLGSSAREWNDLFLSGNLDLGTNTIT